ncbi:MAG: hypothetical protein K9M75_02510 [Phycisphaerae bacterium]|nr:hypothetical protein [Phycisphaerae bacterium]
MFNNTSPNMAKIGFMIVISILLFSVNVYSARNDIEKYGSVKGEPIDGGFFFYDNDYIEAPYVVERRGLEIFVNDIYVGFVPESHDWRIMTDPGDPPAGTKPPTTFPWPGTKDYDKYWGHKYRYIRAKNNRKEAKQQFLDIIRKLPSVASIEMDPSAANQRIIHFESGQTQTISLSSANYTDRPFPPVMSKDELIKMAEMNRELYERKFQRISGYIGHSGGGCIEMGSGSAIKMIEIFISNESPNERMKAISKHYGPNFAGEPFISQLKSMRFSPQLVERFKRIRKELEIKKQMKNVAANAKAHLKSITNPEIVLDIDGEIVSADLKTSETINKGADQGPNVPRKTFSTKIKNPNVNEEKVPTTITEKLTPENKSNPIIWIIVGISALAAIVIIVSITTKKTKQE